MKRSIIIITILLTVVIGHTYAQTDSVSVRRWTLDECVEYALEHNIDIRQAELRAEAKGINLSSSKWAYAPDISVSNSYSYSTGRVLDPTTYQFIENQTVQGNNTSVGASIALFNGMKNMHNLKRARMDLRASLLDADKTRNDTRLNVTAYYLEILNADENILNAEQMCSTLRMQEEKTQKLVDARKVTTADLLQIRAELAKAGNSLLAARNTYDIARLNLCQLLELDDYTQFFAATPTEEISEQMLCSISPDKVIEGAQRLPEVESAKLGIDMAHRDLSIARASYYPSLSLTAGYGSSYSDARQKIFQNPDGTFCYEAYPFFEQNKDNASSYISLSLNIPIFGKMAIRNSVRQQKVAIKQAEYALRSVEKKVDREATQALIDARTAWEKYLSSRQFVASAAEAARQVERKYALGTATVVDYNTALNTLVQAQTELSQAKYEYIFKTEIIRFYINHND